MKQKKRASKISQFTIKPKDREELEIVSYEGQTFIINFDKYFKASNIGVYNNFFIKKSSYEKILPTMCKYINYFLHVHDTDRELLTSYLKVKFALDKEEVQNSEDPSITEKRFTEKNPKELINLIYEVIFTDSIIEKITDLVEENYLDDIETSEASQKYIGKGKKHLESLEFRNKHIKAMLQISFGMKIVAPILFHYLFINNIKTDKNSTVIYDFFRPLFDIFSGENDIYNKLFVYVKTKVVESKSRNSPIYDQRDILGIDEYTIIDRFLRHSIISENMVKFNFSEKYNEKDGKYEENIIGFIKTIMKYQIMFFLKEQYSKNLTELTSASQNADELSGADKMRISQSSIDEGVLVCVELGIKHELNRIIEEHGFNISDDEIEYYSKHLKFSDIQVQLISSYWAKYFGAYRNISLLNRKEFIMITLILKRILLRQNGCETEEFTYACSLPYILTGNLHDKLSTRIIRNNRFTSKVNESYLYNTKIKDKKYRSLSLFKPEYIMALLSKLINSRFTYVSYENQEMLGKDIEYNEDKISDELLFFFNYI